MCGKVKEKREGCSKKRKMLKSERRVSGNVKRKLDTLGKKVQGLKRTERGKSNAIERR